MGELEASGVPMKNTGVWRQLARGLLSWISSFVGALAPWRETRNEDGDGDIQAVQTG
jgi:hypothetical protein